MHRAGGRWWCAAPAYRPWWILRLVRGCTVICAPSAPGCGTGLLAATAAETPFFFFQLPASVVALTLLGLVRVVPACCLFFFLLLLYNFDASGGQRA